MGMVNRFAWLALFHIFAKFGNCMGLIMNLHKSIILYGTCDMEDITYIRRLFGVGTETLVGGMKYLCYHIKQCWYRINYWMWLVDRFDKNITGWEFRCLSLGGVLLSPNQ